MQCRVVRLILFFVVWANPLMAQDWQKLDGLEINQALKSQTFDFGMGKQDFLPDGRTSYQEQEKSWGRWKIKNGQYCSLWPPSDVWVCYDLESKHFGLWLRFTGSNGRIFTGKKVERN